MNKRQLMILAGGLLAAGAAQAHGGAHGLGFGRGFFHPLGGLDHILAMVAVGLWAAQQGGRALWAVPLTFLGMMAAGGLLGMAGIILPLVEAGIAASLLILGLLVALAARLPLVPGIGLVGLLALCHGQAHGLEMTSTGTLGYALGFTAASALLQGVAILGVWGGLKGRLLRSGGAAIAAAGLLLVGS
ncbi:MAG: HupE/UreJ family protein [Candidatus Competibacteraceae bacterium]|nr:HupE/UreJ family protein [Candidatus Competibacteraceae bacterium]